MEKGSPRTRGRTRGGSAVAVLLPGGLSDFGLVSDGRPGVRREGPGEERPSAGFIRSVYQRRGQCGGATRPPGESGTAGLRDETPGHARCHSGC